MTLPVIKNPGAIFKAPPGGFKLAIKNGTPTAMVIGGCIGVGIGVILACNATLKADAILDEIEAEVEKVNHVNDITDDKRYSKEDYQRDLTIVYAKGGAKLLKLYLPAIIVIVGSMVMILGGHKMMVNRYIMSAAAYEAADSALKKYRERVREDLGDAADRKYAYGVKEEVVGTIEEVDDNGKSHKKSLKLRWLINPQLSLLHMLLSGIARVMAGVLTYIITKHFL